MDKSCQLLSMEAKYQEELDPYLIPPLAHLVLDYLTLTFTLDLKDDLTYPIDLQITCQVTPLRNQVIATYTYFLAPVDESPDTYVSRGWTLQKVPEFWGQSPNKEDGWFAIKRIESSPGEFPILSDAIYKEIPLEVDKIHLALMVNEGFSKDMENHQEISTSDFFRLLRCFVSQTSPMLTDYDPPSLWKSLREVLIIC